LDREGERVIDLVDVDLDRDGVDVEGLLEDVGDGERWRGTRLEP
jgi:hypothetical protein